MYKQAPKFIESRENNQGTLLIRYVLFDRSRSSTSLKSSTSSTCRDQAETMAETSGRDLAETECRLSNLGTVIYM